MTLENTSKFRIPAEWEPHKSTWLGWPYNKKDWPGKFSPIPWVYAEIVKKISEGEIVNIIVYSEEEKTKASKVLNSANADIQNVRFHVLQTDRGWLRDSGPVFVKQGDETLLIDFKFNGWSKYRNYKKDNVIPSYISQSEELGKIEGIYKNRQVIFEGGSIDINGRGTIVTTEECLMDNITQVRNPGFTKGDYAEVFDKYLGINNIIWLGEGIEGDDTHGHVDDLCRFVNYKTLLLVTPEPGQPRYKQLCENWERLQDAKLEDGSRPEVVKLPLPENVVFENQILPASYANFYITNSYVLVPTFNDPKDRIALNTISEFFPQRKVSGIHAIDLVWGLGTLHCLTHEEPL